MRSLALSKAIEAAAGAKKARDIVRLNVQKRTSIADYFVICEGDTDRQVRAIADGIMDSLKSQGVEPLQVAGYQEAAWALLDYDSVIVHIFLPGERGYYDLESLWRAPRRTASGRGLLSAAGLRAARRGRIKRAGSR